jgi:hypothetical protein
MTGKPRDVRGSVPLVTSVSAYAGAAAGAG